MVILIKGGRVIDPGKLDGIMDIMIAGGKIVEIQTDGLNDIGHPESKIIDASGKIVVPGLVDMHVHLREPGYEHKETIETGCRSAVAGGFTGVCCMPNTNPVNDSKTVTEYILTKAREAGLARVHPVAAISKGSHGKVLCEYRELKDAGAVALSDDGNPVMNSQLMRRAMEKAKEWRLPVISHCEDLDLAANGVMNEGAVAREMGLEGIPNVLESIMVLRDIALSELTGASIHIAHVSTLESVRAIRDAKTRGAAVTAETAPHYFTLTDASVKGYNTNMKMNPPLRSAQDREAVRRGLADGTIDVIATDHAPHSFIEKSAAFQKAPNGVIGLETALPLGLSLVEDGVLTLQGLIEKMSTNPARILGLKHGLNVGKSADITIVDPERSFRVDAERLQSLSRNTPFDGWDMKGKAVLTMVGGKIVYRDS